jgi:hypothetical protein
MLTHSKEDSFWDDWEDLPNNQRIRYYAALSKMEYDHEAGGGFRAGLRVTKVRRVPGVWEMTWAPDGRATFHYGNASNPGNPHLVWRRIGGHEIFNKP